MTKTTTPYEALPANIYELAYPNSQKVYLEEGDLKVPVRQVALSNDEEPIQIYDTSGPQGTDVRQGLPTLRKPWIEARGDVKYGPRQFSLDAHKLV